MLQTLIDRAWRPIWAVTWLACALVWCSVSTTNAQEARGAGDSLPDIESVEGEQLFTPQPAAKQPTPEQPAGKLDRVEEEEDVFEPAFVLSPDEARRNHELLRRDEQIFRASLVQSPEDEEADRREDLQTLQRSQSVAPYLGDDAPLLIEGDALAPEEYGVGELGPGEYCDCEVCRPWGWTVLPEGLIYRSYLAGVKESRFASVWFHDAGFGNLWDSTLGGRAGLLRYGNYSAVAPQGLQIDIEGAGMPRLGLEENRRELVSSDFRFGVPITIGDGQWQYKLAYYHLSSHLGDEFMLRTGWVRNDFTLDVIVLGASYFPIENVRVYGEAGYALNTGGGSEPWEFQFGAEFAPAYATGPRGAPFMAVNAHLREEVDFGGYVAVQAGWCWRNPVGRLFRIGVQYYNGHSPQYEFFTTHEEQIGAGIWYDF